MTNKIDKKITAYKVKQETISTGQELLPAIVKNGIHEDMERPEMLIGATYKIKTPASDHALYITINDAIIDGQRHPYEIFLNCKEMQYFQWVSALTRVISAVFRKGGQINFLVEELKNTHDPKEGGYFKKGVGFMPSLVAEIGYVLEQHLKQNEN